MNCSTFHAGGKGHEDEVGFSPQPRSCGVRLPSVGEVARDEQTAATYHQWWWHTRVTHQGTLVTYQ